MRCLRLADGPDEVRTRARVFAYDNGDDHCGGGSVGCGVGGGVGDDDAAGSPRHNRQAAHDAQTIEALSTSRSFLTKKKQLL